MDNKDRMKQAYDLIKLPEKAPDFDALTESKRPAPAGKPIKVTRGGTAIAAGLAAVIAVGGIMAAVRIANAPKTAEAPDPVSQAAPVQLKTTAENEYFRLTLTDVKSDGYSALLTFDLDKLYDPSADLWFDNDMNQLFNDKFLFRSASGSGDMQEAEPASKDESADIIRKRIIFDEYTESKVITVSQYLEGFGDGWEEYQKYTDGLELTVSVDKNTGSRTFTGSSGGTLHISELGIYADHTAWMPYHQKLWSEDEGQDFIKTAKIILTGNGGVTSELAGTTVSEVYPKDEEKVFGLVRNRTGISADDIQSIDFYGETYLPQQ
ncbi:MAG: hypothetical protein IKP47_05295 [Ruminococcus sp.]|nr:hypothetical protein [Ruminococcus sp.]